MNSSSVALALVAAVLVVGCAACADTPGAIGETASAMPAVDDAQVNAARYECLLDKGLPVTRDGSGAVSFQDPEGKREGEWEKASAECDADLVEQGLLHAESSEHLRASYRALSAIHDCLVAKDFQLVEWPTEDVYVERDGAFNVLDATSPINLDEARAACPDEFAAADAL